MTRNTGLVAAGLALTGLGLAAGLAWHPSPQTELLSPGSVAATRASLASNEAVVDEAKPADEAVIDGASKQGTPVPLAANGAQTPSTKAPAARQGKATNTQNRATSQAAQPSQYANSSGTGSGGATPLDTQQAAACTHCGVIEAVREVTVKGQGTGLGAVAGGVLGGAVGNKMGKGSGRTAMTVLGAIGGGLAGNEVEKRARSEKAYDVRVRMDDGTVRTLRQKSAPTPGARVTVEGNVLHVTRNSGGEGQMMRTSTGA
jgi:outer membrane lipoprotein SlyB